MKVALNASSGTVTEVGTLAKVPGVALRSTTWPPAGAGRFSDTVISPVVLTDRLSSVGSSVGTRGSASL